MAWPPTSTLRSAPRRSSGSSISRWSCAGTTESRVARGSRASASSGPRPSSRKDPERAMSAVAPASRQRNRIDSPATWLSGSATSQRSSRSSGRLAAEPTALYRWFARVWTTARGMPVLPEVSRAVAGAPGSTGSADAPPAGRSRSPAVNGGPQRSSVPSSRTRPTGSSGLRISGNRPAHHTPYRNETSTAVFSVCTVMREPEVSP